MLVLKGTYDGNELHLEKKVHLDHQVSVLVTFLEPVPGNGASNDYQDFLSKGPTLDSEQLEPMSQFIEGFRKCRDS